MAYIELFNKDRVSQIDDNWDNYVFNRIVPKTEAEGINVLMQSDSKKIYAIRGSEGKRLTQNIEQQVVEYLDNIYREGPIDYKVYEFVPASYKRNTYGLEVFNKKGKQIFTSNHIYMNVIDMVLESEFLQSYSIDNKPKVTDYGKKFAIAFFRFPIRVDHYPGSEDEYMQTYEADILTFKFAGTKLERQYGNLETSLEFGATLPDYEQSYISTDKGVSYLVIDISMIDKMGGVVLSYPCTCRAVMRCA